MPPSLPNRRPLLQLALAVVAGIVADRFGSEWLLGQSLLEVSLLGWWSGAGGCLFLSWWLRQRWNGRAGLLFLLLATVCLGGGWHHLRWQYFAEDHLARFANEVSQPVCVQAVAVDRLKWTPAPPANPLRALPVGLRSEIQVRITQVRDGREWRDAAGVCKLRVNGELHEVMAGDELMIFARIARQPPALNPGEYDWSEVSRGAGQYCDLFSRSPACVSVIKSASSWGVGRGLQQMGQRFEQRLATYVRPEQRDLSQAILLGARERLPQDDRQAFFRTGTIHLLVVSGLHVGLLALVIWTIVCSGFLSRNTGLLVTAVLVVGYALVAGGRPPVMRASVLVVLTLTAYAVGRRISPVNILAAAALMVLAYNPSELFRSGTQLSFLCVAALTAYAHLLPDKNPQDPLVRLIRSTWPWYRKLWQWLLEKSWQTAVASLVVWIVVAPLVAYHFHQTAPISILITPLLWPLVSCALITGLAICAVGWAVPPLAWLLGQVCSFCLWCTQEVVSAAGQIDVGSFYLAGPPMWWVLIFYVGLLVAALALWTRVRWTWHLSAAMIWVAIGLLTAGRETNDGKLHCTFLAVGHGTCVVLELPGGETLLYDAGSLGPPDRAAQTIAGFLWARGISRLDAVVLSHADVDHYNALPGLVERFDIRAVYVSPVMFSPWQVDGRFDAPNHLKHALKSAQVPLREIWVNDRLRTGASDVEIEVLHPPRLGVAGRDNANSLLLAIHYGGHSILLPGDLESPGIEAVIAEQPFDCDILLAPHHGSSHSDPPGFAAWCTPDWVIVSGQQISRSSLTETSYRQVGAKVLQTAELGAVEFALSRQSIKVSSFRSSEAW